jgi:hypothetical protein
VSLQGLNQLEGRAEYLQAITLKTIIATSHKSRAIWKIAKTKDLSNKNIVSSIFYLVGAGRVDND